MMSERSTLTLPAKEIPLYGGYDVLVCGGGPAGVRQRSPLHERVQRRCLSKQITLWAV